MANTDQSFMPAQPQARDQLMINKNYAFLPPQLRQVAAEQVAKTWGNQAASAPAILQHIYQTETRGTAEDKKDTVISRAGAVGRFQLLPKKGAGHGMTMAQLTDPVENTKRGVAYAGMLAKMYNGEPDKVFAGYNWGQGNVNKVIADYGDDWKNHLPKESRDYIESYYAKQGPARDAGMMSPANPTSMALGNLVQASAQQPQASSATSSAAAIANLSQYKEVPEALKDDYLEAHQATPIQKPNSLPIKNLVAALFGGSNEEQEEQEDGETI